MSNDSPDSSAAPFAIAPREIGTRTGATSMQIGITVNGQPVQVAPQSTLADLIESLNRPARGVAVAVNREVVPRRMWAERVLNAGDRVDVVNAIGGG